MESHPERVIIALLFASLSFSACGPEELYNPTLWPTATKRPTSALVATPTRTFTPTETRSPSLTFTPTEPSTPTATPTLLPTGLPTLAFVTTTSGAYHDWPRYIHTVYRFVFAVPPGWQVSELGANYIQLTPPYLPDIKFTIGVRWVGEDVRIQRTGVPEGELVRVGMVPFWGDEISKSILVYQGRDKAVLYNNGTEFRLGDRYFTLGLDDFSLDYGSVDLPDKIKAAADGIVGSLANPE